MDIKFEKTSEIITKQEELQVVWGWASVIKEDGKVVVDSQDDVISEVSLLKAAHEFVTDFRQGKVMHHGRKVATLVESVVFTDDLQKALGIDLKKIGWLIAMKVLDEDVWKLVKNGTLQAFSIGGSVEARVEIKE